MGNEVSGAEKPTVKFTEISLNGSRPDKREAHALVSVSDASLLLFGGARLGGARLVGTVRDETNSLWRFRPDGGWSEIAPSADAPDAPPSARAGAAHCGVGQRLFVFGGLNSNLGWLDDLAIFDSRTEAWSIVRRGGGAGAWPSARDKASMCAVSGNRLVLFGGFGPKEKRPDEDDEMGESGSDDEDEDASDTAAEFGWFNDVHFLDTDSLTWSRPAVTGTPPSPRAAFGMCSVGSKVYVFGGRDTTQRVNDLHVFDADSCSWSQPAVHGTPPAPRSFHSMVAVGSRLVVFGGLSRHNSHFNDIHFFDAETSTWHQATVDPIGQPKARGYAGVALLGSTMYLYGGSAGFDSSTQENAIYFGDLLAADLSPIERFTLPPASDATAPPATAPPTQPTSGSDSAVAAGGTTLSVSNSTS